MIGTVGEETGVVLCDTFVLAGGQVRDGVVIWVDLESVIVPNTLLAVVRDVFVHCLCPWRALRISYDSGFSGEFFSGERFRKLKKRSILMTTVTQMSTDASAQLGFFNGERFGGQYCIFLEWPT